MCDERLINRTEADYKEDIQRHNSTLVPSRIRQSHFNVRV